MCKTPGLATTCTDSSTMLQHKGTEPNHGRVSQLQANRNNQLTDATKRVKEEKREKETRQTIEGTQNSNGYT